MRKLVAAAALICLTWSGASMALDAQNSDEVQPNSPFKPRMPDAGEFNPVPGPQVIDSSNGLPSEGPPPAVLDPNNAGTIGDRLP